MKRSVLTTVITLLAVVALSGCVTFPCTKDLAGRPVLPGPQEQVVLNQALVLVDASDSMRPFDKFGYEKAIAKAFVASMPDGCYEAGLTSFSGVSEGWLKEPLKDYCRDGMNAAAGKLKLLQSTTPLGKAIRSLKPEVQGKDGKGALIIFSDGKATFTKKSVLSACKELKAAHKGELCIYTVHIGDSERGKQILAEAVAAAGCGKAYDGKALANQESIDAMVREIFFGPKPPEPPKGPLDTDGDGVIDDLDQCPGTPKGAKVDERGCWVLDQVLFDTDKAIVKPEFAVLLDEVAAVLKNNPNVRICVDGHTDSRASEAYNLKLSDKRSAAVKGELVKRGIEAVRLESKGYGESKLLAPDCCPANMQKNRRVELTPIP
jgi:OOP family OmpA-OmpF porin